MEEKINTQGMSVVENDEKVLSFTKIQQPVTTPLTPHTLTCFTELQRNELKQLMIEVLQEWINDDGVVPHPDIISSSRKRYDVMERIRDDYHHGGFDEYKL